MTWVRQFQAKVKRRVMKNKKKSFAPYRSGLEKRVAQVLNRYDYEPKSAIVEYMTPHKYHPDFVHPDHPDILIEVKGYFRTSAEATKYSSVKRDNPEKEIIFLFSDPYKKATPNSRPRKDGSVMTLAEWCSKNGFLYFSTLEIPKELVSGDISMGWVREQKVIKGIKLC